MPDNSIWNSRSIGRSERCVIDRTGQEIPILKSVKRIRFSKQEHLLETFMDISRNIQKITRYRTKEYIQGIRIVAIDGAAILD